MRLALERAGRRLGGGDEVGWDRIEAVLGEDMKVDFPKKKRKDEVGGRRWTRRWRL